MTWKLLSLFSLWAVGFITTLPTPGMVLTSKFAPLEAGGRKFLATKYL